MIRATPFGAEGRKRSQVRNRVGPFGDWKTLIVSSAVNGCPFRSSEKNKAVTEEGWAPPLICCAQDTVGILPPLHWAFLPKNIFSAVGWGRRRGGGVNMWRIRGLGKGCVELHVQRKI